MERKNPYDLGKAPIVHISLLGLLGDAKKTSNAASRHAT
jgi:hypothetical protein